MSEAQINDLLDEHMAPFPPRPDGWSDVLRRARRTRLRYAAIGAGMVALLLVPTAVALRGQVTDLFQGTPAPPPVSRGFEFENKVADHVTKKGFARFPQVDVSQAHGVVEVETSDGPERLWAAPNDQGGQCWLVEFANDPAGPQGRASSGGCSRASDSTSPSKIAPGWHWTDTHPTLLTLLGRVLVPATNVEVQLEDGSRSKLPVVEGFFLGSFDKGTKFKEFTAYDAEGNVVANFVVHS
jgi:hypothetical protein